MRMCLYCDKTADSLEHILASGIGGWLVNEHLICSDHNNLAGKYADEPLATQFAYAVNSLEVLKGNGDRGTTLHKARAADGTVVNILPDRSTSMYTRIEKDSQGRPTLIVGTNLESIEKIQKQFEKLKEPPTLVSSRVYMRKDNLEVNIQTGGPACRGILKAALHFAAHLGFEGCRAAGRVLSSHIFTLIDDPMVFVRFGPYSQEERRLGHGFHEMTIWGAGHDTLVRISVFNIVHFVIRLHQVRTATAYRYFQQTQTGKKMLLEIPAPELGWDDCVEDMPAPMKDDLDWRIHQVTTVGSCKNEVFRLIEEAKLATSGFARMSSTDKRDLLTNAVRGFYWPTPISPWAGEMLTEFAARRIADEAATP